MVVAADDQASRLPARPSIAFAVNGRFLSQPVTGVQRYARQIVRAMDDILVHEGRSGEVMVPASGPRPDDLRAFEAVPLGPLTGHPWEQIVLPARCGKPLLNLCNTAPAAGLGHIVCLHDANVFVAPDSYSRSFRMAYQALLPWIARRALRVTTVSKASAMQLAAYLPIAAHAIEVLPNGHEHVFGWREASSALSRRWTVRRPFVLLLGSQARHKNAELIVRQAPALDAMGLDLVVAGGDATIFAETSTTARSNVIRLGVVTDDDLAFLYRRALCLAFPSLTEGFGLPLVEAMALGCPVVSSDRASMPEVCGDAALLAAPDDEAAWLAHIGALAGSAGLRDDLRGRGLQRVALFSWARSARGYVDLIGGAS